MRADTIGIEGVAGAAFGLKDLLAIIDVALGGQGGMAERRQREASKRAGQVMHVEVPLQMIAVNLR
ncbi:hypothetical protein D3C76_392190 [compost metagenome]